MTRRVAVRRGRPDLPHFVSGYAPPARGEDPELERVAAVILAKDPHGELLGSVLRETYDQLYDGQRTGRWNPDQLRKTEKTHMGTLVEINVHRAFEGDQSSPTVQLVRPGLMAKYGYKTRAKAEEKIKVHTDYKELLKDPKIKGVIIALPLHLHHSVAIEASSAAGSQRP